jgi:hypothetical protein
MHYQIYLTIDEEGDAQRVITQSGSLTKSSTQVTPNHVSSFPRLSPAQIAIVYASFYFPSGAS